MNAQVVMTEAVSATATPSLPAVNRVVFVDERKPAWVHQWSEMPAAALAARGLSVERLPYEQALPGIEPAFWQTDAVLVMVFGTTSVALMRQMPSRTQRQARVVLVIADDMWSVPPDGFAELGIEPSTVLSIRKMASRAVTAADAVVGGSEPLVEILSAMTPRACLVPWVAPPAATWPAVREMSSRKETIGWAGTLGLREADFAVLREPYRRLAAQRRELRFVFWGARPSWAGELGERLEYRPHEPFIEMGAYYQALADLGLTLAVAPIAQTAFNAGRSRAKLLEAAAGAGCPLIASDFGPYHRLAEAGAPLITVPNTADAWFAILSEWLDRPDRRATLTEAARRWTAEHATIDSVVDAWIKAVELARCAVADAPATIEAAPPVTVAPPPPARPTSLTAYYEGITGIEGWYEKLPGALTETQCEQIIAASTELLGSDLSGVAKAARVAPLPADDEWFWLYEHVGNIIAEANRGAWDFDLDGFVALQVLVYERGNEYGWHRDCVNPRAPRQLKLAASILLSRPGDFQGGELEIVSGLQRRTDGAEAGPSFIMPLEQRGSGVVFPAFMVHRIRPVTKGQRVVLVARLGGEAFF